ncbi:MAG: YihY/virulence factor BrkB family protein [Chitinophagaceae bacterium]|nr:YihY/virulence factor BrkB family protein [Chitinophagaceae bacterium]MBK7679367.1 YihY/virulence factor BrkB family protein [Chitinophagaceae bacterium]MBK8299289.1 YihY/virulence factor BrkB family protein [Chitinophagaceae bacterium]MBK9659532.1 YihY/virulence factor BrkB family protein [Chitinophagaceae bacterium]MBK9936934.1 YihY/virulence factor BrkB family protein [Chitinophagaceae bacterium]
MIKKIRNKLLSSAPAVFILRKSKETSLPGFRGIPLYDVIKFFFGQVKTIGMTERASAIAFNFVMAIPPAIIFLFTLIPFLPITQRFQEEMYGLIKDVIPGEKDNAVLISFLQDFINKPRNGLLSLGFLLSMFFSSNAMMGIMRSFDKNYIGFRKRTDLQKRGVALKITMILFIIVFVSVLLLISRGAVLKWLGIENPTVINIILNARWIIIILLFFGCISYIYRHAPAVHKKWKLINPGSILATFLMLLLTMLFSWWVGRFGNYNQLYGSIGTVLMLMVLIFINSLILLVGFELNVSISSLKKIADERKDNPADGDDQST